MKVKALYQGYYGDKRVKEGEVFVLKDDEDFSDIWMTEADDKLDPVIEAAKAKPARVQQAPDARDLDRVINEQLGDEKIAYSGGVKHTRRAPVKAPEGEESQHSGEEKSTHHQSGGRVRNALRKAVGKSDSPGSDSSKDVI